MAAGGGGERLIQRRLAERLEKTFYRSQLGQTRPDDLIPLGRYVDDRNRLPPARQLALEIRPGHSGHCNIEDQTSGLADIVRFQKLFGGREYLHAEPELLEQVRQRLPY